MTLTERLKISDNTGYGNFDAWCFANSDNQICLYLSCSISEKHTIAILH